MCSNFAQVVADVFLTSSNQQDLDEEARYVNLISILLQPLQTEHQLLNSLVTKAE